MTNTLATTPDSLSKNYEPDAAVFHTQTTKKKAPSDKKSEAYSRGTRPSTPRRHPLFLGTIPMTNGLNGMAWKSLKVDQVPVERLAGRARGRNLRFRQDIGIPEVGLNESAPRRTSRRTGRGKEAEVQVEGQGELVPRRSSRNLGRRKEAEIPVETEPGLSRKSQRTRVSKAGVSTQDSKKTKR
ncbi:hypothetical protein L227DRAFT_109114 [Lentinus tigrinus ALCF2SS1-6]|uniref:Uncharacterized protein n=1 Tax=Lentinus tigrinus ALCF2SS1-6 TaxID=1328759 RepID=A0A5C2SAK3_9APHY|nr:hypothetical protein L227DRAFT_109114 [Lentinus tigrinus ALCF2SS1-6]